MFALCCFVVFSAACSVSFSTAKLGEMKLGTSKNPTTSMSSFKAEDEIFVAIPTEGAMGAHKVKFRLLADKVEGISAGSVAYKIEKELSVDGNQTVNFNFSVPGGFVPGSYNVEVSLAGEDGKELDKKSAAFTVTGAPKPAAEKKPAADQEDSEDK